MENLTPAELLRALVHTKRASQTPAQRKRPLLPRFHWVYPTAIERRLETRARAAVRQTGALAVRLVKEHYEAWQRELGTTNLKTDASLLDLNAALLKTQAEAFKEGARGPLYSQLMVLGEGTAKFHAKEFSRMVQAATGSPFTPDEPWVDEALREWAETNYRLIKSLNDTQIERLNAVISEGVQSGMTQRDALTEVFKINKHLSGPRARLIARDQIGKLQETLSRHRMKDAGLTLYEWSTSLDERVRSSHAPMEGMICRWDDPTVCRVNGVWVPRPPGAVLLHPGEDFQCRCTALPIFEEIEETDTYEEWEDE